MMAKNHEVELNDDTDNHLDMTHDNNKPTYHLDQDRVINQTNLIEKQW